MNAFLQSMLGKSTEEISYNSTKDVAPGNNETMMEYARSSWIKKLGNSSPKKYQTISSPKLRITSTERQFHNISNISNKVPVMFHSPSKLPDLETIIREFENNFLSPTKSQSPSSSTLKEGNFVKKIVAAIEDKYKAYNDSKIEEDVKAVLDNRKISRSNPSGQNRHRLSLPLESNKKRSNIFGSTSNIIHGNTIKKESKVPVSYNLPENKDNRQKNKWISIFSSTFKYGATKEMKHSQISPKRFQIKQDHSCTKTMHEDNIKERIDGDNGNDNNEDNEDHNEDDDDDDDEDDDDDDDDYEGGSSWNISEIRGINESKFIRVSSPFKTSDDETKSIQSVDLSLTYDFEESTLLEIDIKTIEENTVIASDERDSLKENRREEKTRTNCSESSSSSSKGSRRVPKIIGAFLKKPIKVERTAVDWIPITGKKLPRKRSLKKLLSMLTRNKLSDKKQEKIFSSERNINEEARELQDSGYDEKSTSTSSLKSLASISEILLHQKRTDHLETRRCNDSKLRTFQTRNFLNHVNNANVNGNNDYEREESIDEKILPFKIVAKKNEKIRLTEDSREIVTEDLGPYYPSQTAVMTMSLDRRSHSKSSSSSLVPRSKFSRHPRLSHIPKHPFVSITKIDEILQAKPPPTIVSSFTVSNNDRDKSFRIVREKQSTKECIYDVPRTYLSKSESKLNEIGPESKNKINDEPIYDMPKPCSFSRPTSSIYEDVLSLKRKLDYLPVTTMPNLYSSSEEEPHYATIRRGNKRVHCAFNQQPVTTTVGEVFGGDLRAHESTTSL